MAADRPLIAVLEGSEGSGPAPDLAAWAGLEVPAERRDDYAELFLDLETVAAFFTGVEHAVLEASDPEDGDVYWRVSTADPVALRQEVRDKLIRVLSLDLDLSRRLLALVRGGG